MWVERAAVLSPVDAAVLSPVDNDQCSQSGRVGLKSDRWLVVNSATVEGDKRWKMENNKHLLGTRSLHVSGPKSLLYRLYH